MFPGRVRGLFQEPERAGLLPRHHIPLHGREFGQQLVLGAAQADDVRGRKDVPDAWIGQAAVHHVIDDAGDAFMVVRTQSTNEGLLV